MRDRLILAIPWRELTRNMTRRLSRRGLSVRRTFDLQEARRSVRNGDTASSALHGSCQYLVLQVRRGSDSAAIVVRGYSNSTEITLLRADDSEGRVASEVYLGIEQMRRLYPDLHRSYVLDPVCGMRVDPQKAAATRQHMGQTFHFCCEGCAKAFDEDPHSFLEVPRGSEDD